MSLKVNPYHGWMTQDPMLGANTDYSNFAVRCVRDVVD